MGISGMQSESQLAASETNCPYISTIEDSDTTYNFPSEWNACHLNKQLATPSLEHQRVYCLTELYRQCTVFISESSSPNPDVINSPVRKTNILRIAVFVLLSGLFYLVLGVGGRLLYSQVLPGNNPFSPKPGFSTPVIALTNGASTQVVTDIGTDHPIPNRSTPTPRAQVTTTPAASLTFTIQPTQTYTPTPNPTSTNTRVPTVLATLIPINPPTSTSRIPPKPTNTRTLVPTMTATLVPTIPPTPTPTDVLPPRPTPQPTNTQIPF